MRIIVNTGYGKNRLLLLKLTLPGQRELSAGQVWRIYHRYKCFYWALSAGHRPVYSAFWPDENEV